MRFFMDSGRKRSMGNFLAEQRRRLGLTQEELGERIGVSGKTVSRWETGVYLPGVEALELLSLELGVTADEIIAGKRQTTNQTVTIAENSEKSGGAAEEKQNAAPAEDGNVNVSDSGAPVTFTAEDRLRYFKRKWLRDNIFENVCGLVFCLTVAFAAARLLEIFSAGVCAGAFLAYVLIMRNSMMSYAEERAFSVRLNEKKKEKNEKTAGDACGDGKD